jgi:hypothetical protein
MHSSHDIRSCVLQHIDTFQHLGMLARTNKAFRTQVYSSDTVWTDLGQKVCGEAHWPSVNHQKMGARELTRMRVCPWTSEPRRFEVPMLHSIRAMGGAVSVRQLEVSHEYCILTAAIRGGGLVRDANHAEIMTDAYGTTCRNDAIQFTPGPRHIQPTLATHEIDMMRMLNATKWRPYELYPSAPMIDAVRMVHETLFMVFCNELGRAHSILYFVSARTLSVLHTRRCFMRPHWRTRNVCVRPGEMWIFEDNHKNPTLTYFGPVGGGDHHHYQAERGVRDAFWAAFRGNVPHALGLLARNGVQANEIYRLQEDRHRLVDAVMLGHNNANALDQLLTRLPDFTDVFLLYRAIDMGSLDMVSVLLRHGVDPADDGSEPLFRAIRSRRGSLDLYHLLVSHGARVYPCCMMHHIRPWTDPGIIQRLLLLWAGDDCIHEDNPLFVHWLLNGGDYAEPMRAAAATHPALPNQPNENGLTPLMLAAASLCVENVAALLDLKADPRARDNENRSAYDWCDAAVDSTDMPIWYMDAYNAFDAPAAFDFDDGEREANAQVIRKLLE